jgi:nitroreductase
MTITPRDVLEVFNFRHACKEFDIDKKIKKEDFDLILEAGHLSPSSFGLEPWKFLVVQDASLREKLSECTWGGKKQIPTASHVVVILVRRSTSLRPNSEYVSHIARDIQNMSDDGVKSKVKYLKKFQEIEFDLNNDRTILDWAGKQTYIALANMMTAAAMIGIDSCPIEGFDMKDIEEILKKDFKINLSEFGISCMVTFGYRKLPQRKKNRQPINEIIKYY